MCQTKVANNRAFCLLCKKKKKMVSAICIHCICLWFRQQIAGKLFNFAQLKIEAVQDGRYTTAGRRGRHLSHYRHHLVIGGTEPLLLLDLPWVIMSLTFVKTTFYFIAT